jgi:hypothetical protein
MGLFLQAQKCFIKFSAVYQRKTLLHRKLCQRRQGANSIKLFCAIDKFEE